VPGAQIVAARLLDSASPRRSQSRIGPEPGGRHAPAGQAVCPSDRLPVRSSAHQIV
jgi:hypothetical protein